jgi:hypothetical protein
LHAFPSANSYFKKKAQLESICFSSLLLLCICKDVYLGRPDYKFTRETTCDVWMNRKKKRRNFRGGGGGGGILFGQM